MLAQSVIDGDTDVAMTLANQADVVGVDPLEAINKRFVVGINLVGTQFNCGNAFLPELVMAGEALKAPINTLEPDMQKRGSQRTTMKEEPQ